MKRHRAPEEVEDDGGPLFARAEAEARRGEGMARAINHAEIVAPGWQEAALRAIEKHARAHRHFLAEDVAISFPDGVDARALGPVVRSAVARALIVHDGYAPANSSNRSPKCRWKSLVFGSGAH